MIEEHTAAVQDVEEPLEKVVESEAQVAEKEAEVVPAKNLECRASLT